MHIFSQSFTYDHGWDHVNMGLWKKYPNPHCTHVVTVDVLDRSVDPRTGVIRTERLLGCKQKAPLWIVKLLGGSEDAFVREVSFVDPKTQHTAVHSVNLSLSQYVTCVERIHYTAAPSGSTLSPSPSSLLPSPAQKTLFSQTAAFQARMRIWKSVGDKLEGWLTERFDQNAQLGREGLESVLDRLWPMDHRKRIES